MDNDPELSQAIYFGVCVCVCVCVCVRVSVCVCVFIVYPVDWYGDGDREHVYLGRGWVVTRLETDLEVSSSGSQK